MQKTVFVLGAGASAESGAPLMSTFLDRARDLLVAGAVRDTEDDFKRVFNALVRLRDVFFKSGLDLDNVESVFGTFEMARLIGKLGNYSLEQIDGLARSIRMLIVRTLDESIRYSYHHAERKAYPTHGYEDFVSLIKLVKQKGNYDSACSVLTFNYDIALDFALTHGGVPHDYCLDLPTGKDALRLLKLHGSLNWGRCPKCGRIKVQHLSMENVLATADRSPVSSFALPAATLVPRDECANCGGPLPSEPVLVPPTWNKTEGHNELTAVWKQAAAELSRAENIVCIGYSLPESDLFFRYLFALGTVGDAHVRRLWVFDPDPTQAVEERYRRLIGRGIERRFRFFRNENGLFSKAVSRKGELWPALM